MKAIEIKRIAGALTIFALIVGACSGKKESSGDQNSWAAMDSFHMIMAESYHPVKDSANLAPAKANAEMMAAEAVEWAAGEIPDRVNNDDMKAMLENLKTNSASFAEKVKAGATDEELAAAITSLHDDFHHIMEAWEGGHDDHKEHH